MLDVLMTIECEDDREFIVKLWRQHEDKIFSFAFSFLKNVQDAEDVQMSVITKVIKNIDSFRDLPEKDVSALLYTYAKNAAISLYKKKKREFPQEIEINSSFFGLREIENTVITNDIIKNLKEIIKKLPNKYSDVVILCCFMGLKTGDAAKILGISSAKAYSRLNYAKTLIKKEYDKKNK